MALLHRAELTPGKLDMLTSWLPGRPWYAGPPTPSLTRVGAFRFDDPAGAVGLETLLVQADPDGPIFQTPLTYRDAPLPGAETFLVGTTEHSVLGTRWVYDAAGDPVYAAALAGAVLTGGTEAAEEVLAADGTTTARTPLMSVRGTGSRSAPVPPVRAVSSVADGDPTVISAGSVLVTLYRIVPDTTLSEAPSLLWGSRPLALVRVVG
ncbi:CG0192-related protein [Dactylosporangium sp. CS-033363]|uniref:CG0192-related protein n=1 Tax=Dactylosporangium sp. CS-033363 TaxID=3239935 RepID=UPI003D90253B